MRIYVYTYSIPQIHTKTNSPSQKSVVIRQQQQQEQKWTSLF